VSNPNPEAAFAGLVELAGEEMGGRVLAASDDFFAEKENLIKPGRGVFIEGKYTERGKWMDGWESRRKRVPAHDQEGHDPQAHDWCVLRLAVPGRVQGVDIDTNFFLGNHPPYAAIDAASAADDDFESFTWREILPRSPLRAGSQNLFATLAGQSSATHLRLRIYPDGGVARLRVYGEVDVALERDREIDLAARLNGATAICCSDMFFGRLEQLIFPGRPANMGGGWETRRRRGPGFDWAIVRLAARGAITRVEVDTCHFKGNFPDRCSLEACHAPAEPIDLLNWAQADWQSILGEQKLAADSIHSFALTGLEAWDYVKLNIYPDGGVARLRVWGRIS
jgi:allantoicase